MHLRAWLRRLGSCVGIVAGLAGPLASAHAESAAPARGRPRAASPAPARGRTTSLDPALQVTTHRLLAEAHPLQGGIVAVHVPSGRIVAWQEYRRSGQSTHPNTQAVTPAASLFKLVTTVALFERGGITPEARVCISGGEHGIDRTHLMPPPPGAPHISCRPFEEALGHSRNAVFAQLGTELLMRSDLVEVAERLGFNRPLPFDVPAQLGVLDVPYNDLEFARTATGFQGSRLSVLGAAQLGLIVASGGRPPRMTFAAAAPASATDPVAESPTPDEPPVIDSQTARRMRRMLEVTVSSGTSRGAFTDADGRSYLGSIRAAGKTGTLRPNVNGPTASWFVGFAPSRAPELLVSVMLDNSPVWRLKANHVARDVFRAYFDAAPGVTHPFEPASAGAPHAERAPSP